MLDTTESALGTYQGLLQGWIDALKRLPAKRLSAAQKTFVKRSIVALASAHPLVALFRCVAYV